MHKNNDSLIEINLVDSIIADSIIEMNATLALGELFLACSRGDLEKVELLISKARSKGVDIVNEKDNHGYTPLHLASCYGYVKVAELLISKRKSIGIDIVNEKDNRGYTPLHLASIWGHLEVMELLISYGADYTKLMEELEKEGKEKRKEELERVVIEVCIDKVKMI